MASPTPSTAPKTATRSAAERNWATFAHVSPLLFAVNASIIAGRPFGWIGFLLPVGPLIVGALMRATSSGPAPHTPRGFRSLLGFTIVSALIIGGGWTFTQAGQWWTPLSYVFPLALLLFTMGLLNFVMIAVSRTIRAWKGQQFDYPWVVSPVARLVGLPPIWEE